MKAVCKICKKEVDEIKNFHIVTPYHVIQNITITEPDISFCDDCWEYIKNLRKK